MKTIQTTPPWFSILCHLNHFLLTLNSSGEQRINELFSFSIFFIIFQPTSWSTGRWEDPSSLHFNVSFLTTWLSKSSKGKPIMYWTTAQPLRTQIEKWDSFTWLSFVSQSYYLIMFQKMKTKLAKLRRKWKTEEASHY